jgi:hypothetical protein
VTTLGPESWRIDVTVAGSWQSFGDAGGLILLEPVTGQLSDVLFIDSAQFSQSGPTTFRLLLSSDNESGTFAPPATAVLGCSAVPPPCRQAVGMALFSSPARN